MQSFGIQTNYAPVAVDPNMLQRFNSLRSIDEGTYDGPTDEDGLRCGVGTCIWADGSRYEGEWLNGLRHGNGKYISDFQEYVGQWHTGMKHGRGKLTVKNPDGPDQEPIFGPFENDHANGLFSVSGKTVMYKQDLAI